MSNLNMPKVIHVHVYEDYLPHFEDQGKVWRVSDHKPPFKFECETTPWVRKDLVDELIEAVNDKTIAHVALMVGEETHQEFSAASEREVSAIAAIRSGPTPKRSE